MSILLRKGLPYNAEYTSSDFPTLTADSVGSVSIYATYPGTAVFTKAMTRSGNTMLFGLTIAEIINLPSGVYSFVSSITPVLGGETVMALEYATVTDATVFTTPMTRLYATIAKSDGTPAGRQTRTITHTTDGVVVNVGWEGIPLTVTHPLADTLSGVVIGTEVISTTTDAAGYAELYVVRGMTVTVSCPAFATPAAIDTTGLTDIDLSTYF